MKRSVVERDRREKENNVIISGMSLKKENLKGQVEVFLEEKLEVKGEIETARFSDNVVVAKLGRKIKKEVMLNKSKLVGSKIFIENDLTFDERKKQ